MSVKFRNITICGMAKGTQLFNMEVEEKFWCWEGQDCGLGTQKGLSPEELEPA